jgi:hypothetical protein
MINKSKTFAIAVMLVGASVSASVAQVTNLVPPYAVENISVQLVGTFTYQDPATTNDHSGTITDKATVESINTGKFLQILASNIGISNLSKSATLIKVTELTMGTNFTNIITNSGTTLVTNATLFYTNPLYTTFVYSNLTTNGPALVTNSDHLNPESIYPGSTFTLILSTNYQTNFIQGTGDTVMIPTNGAYYLNNGPGLDTNNFIPLGTSTNDNASASGSVGPTTPFLRVTTPVYGTTIESQGITSNFFLAQEMTNASHIFAGTITKALDISGTLYNESASLSVGPPRQPVIGTPAPPQLSVSGTANATSASSTVGKGKAALPYTSWNETVPVTGSGSIGGVVSNTVSTNTYTYGSNGTYLTFSATALFDYYSFIPYILTGPQYYDGTNTIGYTNVSTNLYTNFVVTTNLSGSLTNIAITGKVTVTFMKIVQ